MSTQTDTTHPPTEAESSIPSVPLAEWHRSLGASLTPYRGVEAPAVYSGVLAESAALRERCGLVDRSWLELVEMRGEDRARFLNGLVTCDVKCLEPGEGTYGFVTNVKGRVLADLAVLALDDRLWLELSPGTSTAVTRHLRKYVIVDRVEIEPLEGAVPLTLIGPRSATVLVESGLAAEALTQPEYGHLKAVVCGREVHLVKEPALGESGEGTIEAWTLWTMVDDAPALFEALVEHGAAHGLLPAGHRALDQLRVEAGRPLYGLDFDVANFPQETGLEDAAVSYTKGCYLGQEVVARIHYRGGVNRHLRQLVFSEPSATSEPAADLMGRSLRVDDREVGQVTSVADTGSGQHLGLAILHQRAEPDMQVDIEGGGKARVVALGPPAVAP